MSKWNPDPGWPAHIVALAERIADGEDCRDQLHDALLDEGLPESAAMSACEPLGGFSSFSGWAKGWLIGWIVGDGYITDSKLKTWWEQNDPQVVEVEAYLKRRNGK